MKLSFVKINSYNEGNADERGVSLFLIHRAAKGKGCLRQRAARKKGRGLALLPLP